MAQKSLLLVCRHSPYGSPLARAGLDAALAAAAFEQSVTLLFLGDGVLQLVPGQDGRAAGQRDIGKLLASLPLYDIEQVFVDAEAMARYRIDAATLSIAASPVDGAQLQQLLNGCDHVLGF